MPSIEEDTIEAEIVDDSDSPATDIALASDVLPDTLYLLPLSERPFFPAQALPLLLSEDPWLPTLQAVSESEQKMVGLVLTNAESPEMAVPRDFYPVGTVAHVHKLSRDEDRIQFIAQGFKRFRIVKWLSKKPPYHVQVEYPEEVRGGTEEELRAYAMAIINTIKEMIPLNPLYSEELKFFLNRFNPNEPALLADFAASMTTANGEELQEVLATLSLLDRMKKVIVIIKKELEVARLQSKIHRQVEEKMSEQQRKFFLGEQLKVIQKELGLAKDDRTADVERFRERLKTLTLPEPAQKRVDDELNKLSILESGSPEYGVTRNYLDVITDLPWGVHSKDRLNLKNARKVLDEEHDALDDVKDRIIEFLAVGALRGEVSGSIVLLVGPPGVGKTSIGRSIATALGREFYRVSVGGMRDEAEIKGHRRTYIGAMPGKIIQAVRESKVSNPVIMLDEVDKIGASFHGDPASALLEVLDPEQNNDFLDHYLDTRFDLSKVLFICTANQLDTIPGPLLDRMETIRLSGYISREKVNIAKHHLWPRLLDRAGVLSNQLKISDAALRRVVDGYAREAGVRNLEKQLARIIRKVAVKIVNRKRTPIKVNVLDVETYLGTPWFLGRKPLTGIGVVTGLAWTAMGGATLDVEATKVHNRSSGFKLTGRLGETMQESASIAHSYISGHLDELGADPEFFDKAFVHVHVPAGATPKDGPSAGVTMASALLSLARGKKIPRRLGMTGELTLTGHVLPVGGIREKVIAARRDGIRELILPETCRGDFDELPDYVREGMTVHFVDHFADVVKLIFPNKK